MTKSERRLRPILKKWTTLLGLADWDIAIELTPPLGDIDSGGIEVAADCLAHWEYTRAVIRFDEAYTAACPIDHLEGHVVHELMHVMLNEMRDYKKNKQHEERTATVLTRAFLNARALLKTST